MDKVNKRQDKIIKDNKDVIGRMASVERDNGKLKQINDGLHCKIAKMKISINQFEQNTKMNGIVMSGVKETFTERTDDACADNPTLTTREDTVSTVYSVILKTCKFTMTSSDVKSA